MGDLCFDLLKLTVHPLKIWLMKRWFIVSGICKYICWSCNNNIRKSEWKREEGLFTRDKDNCFLSCGQSGDALLVFPQQQKRSQRNIKCSCQGSGLERASPVGFPVFPVWSAQRVKAQSELNCKKLVSKGNCSHRSSWGGTDQLPDTEGVGATRYKCKLISHRAAY